MNYSSDVINTHCCSLLRLTSDLPFAGAMLARALLSKGGVARHFAPSIRSTTSPLAPAAAMARQLSALKPSNPSLTSAAATSSVDSPSLTERSYLLFHPVHPKENLKSITPKHREPKGMGDSAAFSAVGLARGTFDYITGYAPTKSLSQREWLARFIFLETVRPLFL